MTAGLAGRAGRFEALKWLPVVAAAAFYAVFIARARVSLGGRTAWVLGDDPMISMTFARNLAEGHGLVWGNGARVEGYSNLLWTLWMAVVHLLPVSDLRTSLLVMIGGAVVLVLTVIVVARICRLLAPGRSAVAAAAMLLTGLFYPLADWTLTGMEVGLVALLISLIALLSIRLEQRFDRRTVLGLAAAMSAAVLTRDDLIVPCLVAIAFLLWAGPRAERRRVAIYLGGAVAATLAGHEIFRLAYYHDALPNTYYLKLAHVPLGTRLGRGLESAAYALIQTLLAPLALAFAYALARGRAIPRGAILVAALFAGQCMYSVLVGGDFAEELRFANRYLAAAAPMLMVLAALGLGELVTTERRGVRAATIAAFVALALILVVRPLPTGRLGFKLREADTRGAFLALGIAAALVVLAWGVGRLRAARAPIWIAVAVVALACLVTLQVNLEPGRRWARGNAHSHFFDAGSARYGLVLRALTPPGTHVAMSAAGSTEYFSRRPGVDLLGKVDPVIAKGHNRVNFGFRPGHSKWDYRYSLGRLRPEVVASLYAASPLELCAIAGWGYRQVAPNFYVRRGAPGIDAAALGAAIRRAHFWRIPQPPPPRWCSGAVGSPGNANG